MIKLVMILVSEETLLQCTDLASCVRLLKPEHINTGLELIRRIQERLVAILQHSTQVNLLLYVLLWGLTWTCLLKAFQALIWPSGINRLFFWQDFRVGYQSKTEPDQETAQASNLANNTDTNKEWAATRLQRITTDFCNKLYLLFYFFCRAKSDGGSDSGDSDNNNNAGDEAEEDDEYDDEYVPEWHEDYDEEEIDDDDFFSDDDESENLERDFSPFD